MEKNETLTIMRRARPDEKERILELVGNVFEIEQGIPRDMDDIPEEKFPQWWCIEVKDKLAGAIVSWEEPDGVHLGRFVIHPKYRHRHLGTHLLGSVIGSLFAQGYPEVRGDARDVTLQIILKMGGRIIGEPYEFYGSNCTPFVVEREAFEQTQILGGK